MQQVTFISDVYMSLTFSMYEPYEQKTSNHLKNKGNICIGTPDIWKYLFQLRIAKRNNTVLHSIFGGTEGQ